MNQSSLAQLRNLALRVRPHYDLPTMLSLRQFMALGVIGQTPLNLIPSTIEIQGNLVPAAALQAALTNILQNGLSGDQQGFQTTAGASLTLTALQNLFQRFTTGGACTVTLDSAYNIVATLQNPFNGMTFPTTMLTIAATTVATPTLSDTAVTLAGTTSLAASTVRWFQNQITQLFTTVGTPVTAGTTFTSIAQVGSTNNFTVTLGTNALVPVVGNVILINVTTGTLPSGWYPINKVTSATSFVIATPPGTVWTATAATIPGTIVVPTSQYTLGSPLTGAAGSVGVYSPLLTITGMGSAVTASA